MDPKLNSSRLIHIISDVRVLTLAYELIKSKPGNTTPGLDGITLDGISLDYLTRLSKLIKAGKFKFSQAKRIDIPKPNKPGESRPLTIASPREKIVQKAIWLVLFQIYEPKFLDCSHGSRPGRAVETALADIDRKFKGVT